ncbi:hypothetical protein [Parvicella tangerina]|uniref:Uncharacterized protein n=1 Tax=Parvicella tangerina TaxID=2829795 RepID=A0A916JPY8_9FLAO|nr:hypothetical protein [Parvicella tangerina]CAG5083753.1 hypothetical protein CRYO30217_02280 [Parvicella tangerina]
MAKVRSIANLNGKLGDVVFFKRNGRTIVRTKRADMSKRLKEDACYEGHRNRYEYLKVVNAFATAIYRMGKEYAQKTDYKSHNKLYSRISQVLLSHDIEDLPLQEIRKHVKGLVLNFKETLPPISAGLHDDDIILGCDTAIEREARIKILIGTLPKVRKYKDKFKADVNMQAVDIIEFTVYPEDHLQNIKVPIALQEDQVVVVITNYFDGEYEQEWVRVV